MLICLTKSTIIINETLSNALILVIICAKYEKNPSWTADFIEWTQDMQYFA